MECANIYVYVWVWACVYMCMEEKVNIRYLNQLFSTLFLKTGSLAELGQDGWPLNSRDSLFTYLHYWGNRYLSGFYSGAGDPNSGSYSYMAGALPTETSP